MQVINLNIERRPSYDHDWPNQLVGIAQLQGPHGKLEVKLSPSTVANIFELIKKDAQRVADYNASQVGQAIEDAQGEQKLLTQNIPDGEIF